MSEITITENQELPWCQLWCQLCHGNLRLRRWRQRPHYNFLGSVRGQLMENIKLFCVRCWRTLFLGRSTPILVEKDCALPWRVFLWLWSRVKDRDTCVMLSTCTVKIMWLTKLIKRQGYSTFLSSGLRGYYLTISNVRKLVHGNSPSYIIFFNILKQFVTPPPLSL